MRRAARRRPQAPLPLWLLLAPLLLLAGTGRATRRLAALPPAPAGDQEDALLLFASQLSNWQSVKQANRIRGWASGEAACPVNQTAVQDAGTCDPDSPVFLSAERNAWTGVACDGAARVACLSLPGLGLRGRAGGALQPLSAVPTLQYLNLASNRLTGALPTAASFGLGGLQALRLEQNALNGSLPPGWGSAAAGLEVLLLQGNDLSGTLPGAWGEAGAWPALRTLNLSANRLYGSVPESWGNGSAFASLEAAVLQPGNEFCEAVPDGFPAAKATGAFLTGPTSQPISSFQAECKSPAAASSAAWSGDSSGDSLSSTAVAGIITGEVLLGTFLLLCSGIVHRRYRWRSERSWVLFDWQTVEPPPHPRFTFGRRFGGWGGAKSGELSPVESSAPPPVPLNGSGGLGSPPPLQPAAAAPNGSGLPQPPRHAGPVSAFAAAAAPGDAVAAQGPLGPEGGAHLAGLPSHGSDLPLRSVASGSVGSASEVLWRDSLLPSEDVTLQLKPDGSPHQLGNGSFGKVFKGLLQDVHEVAVKVFEGIAGQREQELLAREIAILRGCRNKNIVQFFGVCVRGCDVWMVMELMEGNLFRHLARGHHATWYFRGRSIALDVARGMHFLHARRIVHMDLKSPNILLGGTGVAKIADVGLARVMGSESILNQVCAGTMHWMAPEVLINARCTEKADIFSFGVILWEICTAEAPSRGRMSPVSVPDECPQEVADLIEACMAESPEARPSALQIIHALQAVPVSARPVPQPPWYAR